MNKVKFNRSGNQTSHGTGWHAYLVDQDETYMIYLGLITHESGNSSNKGKFGTVKDRWRYFDTEELAVSFLIDYVNKSYNSCPMKYQAHYNWRD